MTSSINEKIVQQIKAKKAENKILETAQVEEVKRARDEKGHYIADDLSTPDVNEQALATKRMKLQKQDWNNKLS